MDESALKAHIAYSAGVTKSQSVVTGAGAILDLLRKAGAIEERDGKFVVGSPLSPTAIIDADSNVQQERQTQASGADAHRVVAEVRSGSVAVQVVVRVDCKPEDLDGLGVRLRKLAEDFGGDFSSDPSTAS